uniref:Uncharacterized protein n=1 Tax=Anopheles coluzzii TaxID=1518534 RepID=A0A8W7PH97_ANOCL
MRFTGGSIDVSVTSYLRLIVVSPAMIISPGFFSSSSDSTLLGSSLLPPGDPIWCWDGSCGAAAIVLMIVPCCMPVWLSGASGGGALNDVSCGLVAVMTVLVGNVPGLIEMVELPTLMLLHWPNGSTENGPHTARKVRLGKHHLTAQLPIGGQIELVQLLLIHSNGRRCLERCTQPSVGKLFAFLCLLLLDVLGSDSCRRCGGAMHYHANTTTTNSDGLLLLYRVGLGLQHDLLLLHRLLRYMWRRWHRFAGDSQRGKLRHFGRWVDDVWIVTHLPLPSALHLCGVFVDGKLCHRRRRRIDLTGLTGRIRVIRSLRMMGGHIAGDGFDHAHQYARIRPVALGLHRHQRYERIDHAADVHDRVAGFLAHRRERVDAFESVQQQHDVVQAEKQTDLIVQLLVEAAVQIFLVGLLLGDLAQHLQAADDDAPIGTLQPFGQRRHEAPRHLIRLRVVNVDLVRNVAQHVQPKMVEIVPPRMEAISALGSAPIFAKQSSSDNSSTCGFSNRHSFQKRCKEFLRMFE